MTKQFSALGFVQRASARLLLTVAIAACTKDGGSTLAPMAAALYATPTSANQMATVGQQLAQPITVVVHDQYGNVAVGTTVTWKVIDGAGSTSAATSLTDQTGAATVSWTLDTIARLDSLTATLPQGESLTITATGQAAAPASEAIMSGDAQAVVAGSATAALVVIVVDQYNNPVAGVTVSWTATGGGTLSADSVVTDAHGMAQATFITPPTPGTYGVVATAGTAVVTFTENAN